MGFPLEVMTKSFSSDERLPYRGRLVAQFTNTHKAHNNLLFFYVYRIVYTIVVSMSNQIRLSTSFRSSHTLQPVVFGLGKAAILAPLRAGSPALLKEAGNEPSKNTVSNSSRRLHSCC